MPHDHTSIPDEPRPGHGLAQTPRRGECTTCWADGRGQPQALRPRLAVGKPGLWASINPQSGAGDQGAAGGHDIGRIDGCVVCDAVIRLRHLATTCGVAPTMRVVTVDVPRRHRPHVPRGLNALGDDRHEGRVIHRHESTITAACGSVSDVPSVVRQDD